MTTTSYKSNVTGNEAKRNVVRSLAKGAGVDPVAAFKAGFTPVHISEIKEDGEWIAPPMEFIALGSRGRLYLWPSGRG